MPLLEKARRRSVKRETRRATRSRCLGTTGPATPAAGSSLVRPARAVYCLRDAGCETGDVEKIGLHLHEPVATTMRSTTVQRSLADDYAAFIRRQSRGARAEPAPAT